MASKRISEFSSGGTALYTDKLVVARGGANYQISLEEAMLSLDPVWRLFGNPTHAFEFNTSSLTGLTALSGATPDGEDAHTTVPGYYYLRDSTAAHVPGRYFPISPPFTAITKMQMQRHTTNVVAGLTIGQAAPGAMWSILKGTSPSGGEGDHLIMEINWTSPSVGYASSSASHSQAGEGDTPVWLAIRSTSSTNSDMLYSFDGLLWTRLLAGFNPAATVGSVGLVLNAGGGVGHAAIFDYLRIWNSALATFPGEF